MGRVHVSRSIGNDGNPGSDTAPLMSLAAALSSPSNREIIVDEGVYTEIIDVTLLDRVRRVIVGTGDVFFAAQGNPSSFSGIIKNNHIFRNIKFINYSNQAAEISGGTSIFQSCFFKPRNKTGSRIFYLSTRLVTAITLDKCTSINNESLFEIAQNQPANVLVIPKLQNNLFFNQTYHIKRGPNIDSFANFLSSDIDKGNYYNGNINLSNGGLNSDTAENPPLFVDSTTGNYDLQPNSTLIGAGYLGSDIGSYRSYSPFTADPTAPFSIFDAGWRNDSRYYNILTNSPGPDGPSDAGPIIQYVISGATKWLLDRAAVPSATSGRLISPVQNFGKSRTISRISWSAEEDRTLAAGQKETLSASLSANYDIEFRGQNSPFLDDNNTLPWFKYRKNQAINIIAQYVQVRITFRRNSL